MKTTTDKWIEEFLAVLMERSVAFPDMPFMIDIYSSAQIAQLSPRQTAIFMLELGWARESENDDEERYDA